jgi:phenylacetate-CoA ligase
VREPGGSERPARAGELGEVVLTDLHNYGMPFVRYANGDLAIAGPEAVCPCGRGLPRLASVEGRLTETLRDAQGGRVGGMVFNLIFSPLADAIRQFQAVQHRDGSITLRVVPRAELGEEAREHLRRGCEKYLRGVPIRTEVVREIGAAANGKRQIVSVER